MANPLQQVLLELYKKDLELLRAENNRLNKLNDRLVEENIKLKNRLLREKNEIEKIDHLNAPVKYKEIYINNAKKEDENI